MGDSADSSEKVPGHSPAVKIGGMRVTAPSHSSSEETGKTTVPLNSVANTAGDAALALANQKNPSHQSMAHHEESVKHKHSKPQPTVIKSHNPPKPHIQQPSKQ